MDNTDNIQARADLAVCYHNLGKLDLSKQQFEQIFTLKPDFISLKIYYANLLTDMKMYDDATKEYQVYIKAYPNSVDADKFLANVYKLQVNDDVTIKNL